MVSLVVALIAASDWSYLGEDVGVLAIMALLFLTALCGGVGSLLGLIAKRARVGFVIGAIFPWTLIGFGMVVAGQWAVIAGAVIGTVIAFALAARQQRNTAS